MIRSVLAGAVVLAVGVLGASSASAADAVVLFDGKSTEAWKAYGKTDPVSACGWEVKDGTLKTVPGATPRCDLATKDTYKDFDLELEWKVSPGGNSGVMFDVAETDSPAWHTGPEMQVLDDLKHKDGQNPKTSAGSLYALVAPTGKTLKPVGEWNHARLVKKGTHAEHWLNGKKILEYEVGSPALAALIAESKFKDMPKFFKEGQGRLVLQHHGEEVWYRNVKVKKL
jgi:hypothetical protein